jgi:succinate dehydrogenase / fumarate reductase cytochrome b subunit
MLVSILHRATGTALAVGGGILFTWWLAAAAAGPAAYANFHYYAVQADPGDGLGFFANIVAKLIAIGLSWSFFQHLFSGVRHLVMDTGAGYELRANKMWAIGTIVASVTVTIVVWACILFVRH